MQIESEDEYDAHGIPPVLVYHVLGICQLLRVGLRRVAECAVHALAVSLRSQKGYIAVLCATGFALGVVRDAFVVTAVLFTRVDVSAGLGGSRE